MGGPCKNSSWINFCQLWLKCVVLDVSDTIVLCFILLLASLAPATINPTMVRQELQVTVARVTVVQPDRHHYSSSQLPRASAAARFCCREGCGRLMQRGGKFSGRLSALFFQLLQGNLRFASFAVIPSLGVCWVVGGFVPLVKVKSSQSGKCNQNGK